MPTTMTLEDLERIFQAEAARIAPDRLIFLYSNLVPLESRETTPERIVCLFLLKAKVLAEMEPPVYIQIAGEGHTGHDAVEAAREAATHALATIAPLHDDVLEGRVQLFLGQLERRVGNFPAAVRAYRASAELLERAAARSHTPDASLVRDQLEATIKLVSMEFFCGLFEEAQRSLEKQMEIAHRMVAEGVAVPFDEETVEWMRALLARQHQKLAAALASATRAAEIYLRKEPSISTVRILWVTSEIALDLAEISGADDPSRQEYENAVRRYLDLTKMYAEHMNDSAGIEMAKFSEARLRQVENPATRVATNQMRAALKRIEKDRAWDWSLKVDAYITLGRILAIRGQHAEANEAFDQAISIADEHHSPGMAWYAAKARGR